MSKGDKMRRRLVGLVAGAALVVSMVVETSATASAGGNPNTSR
jgi:hypothetical protein